jgi:hypothetical protein
VTSAAVCDWEAGKKEPKGDNRLLIEATTEGAVPIESWSSDPEVREAMRTVLARRAARQRRRSAAAAG